MPRPALIPKISPQARVVLESRYLHRHADGQQETPADMFWRVARAVAAPEARYGGDPEAVAERFYEALASLRFLPNSPTLGNAGRALGQLSACFVLPVEDSLDGIFDAVKNAARIHGSGGGTGFSFSRLRPKDELVREYARASGPVAFMQVFDAATGAVRQGGVRRGANMGILRVDHPDVREFVQVKRRAGVLTHFNISVAVTDAFMQALEAGTDYALIHPKTQEPCGRLDARDLWAELCDSAWTTGDPGLVFIDRINATHPTPALGSIESTNPCGELPLLPFESCNLGSVNLVRHLDAEGRLDEAALRETIRLGVRFLDDVIDANEFPLAKIGEVTRATRKIGLGVMGWADLLIAHGIPYASEAALALAERLGALMLETAREASRELCAERGAFPAWEGSRWQEQGLEPLRNSTVTTIAPTGTISILADCSSGIEPLYALAYRRSTLDGQTELRFSHPGFERVTRARGVWSSELAARVEARGTLAGEADVPEETRRLLQTAHEVEPEWHVRHQAAWQKNVENAVSKTVNLPNESAPADVDAIYRMAYALGCKGITVYRDGSRTGQVLVHPTGPACGGPECAEPGLLGDEAGSTEAGSLEAGASEGEPEAKGSA